MKKSKYPIVVIFLLILFSYGNSISGDFIWDDKPLIVENPAIHDPSNAATYFTCDLYGKTHVNYYRPLLQLSFLGNYLIFHSNTFGYHLVNLLLHFCVALLFYLFLGHISGNVVLALFSSAIFAVHPLHGQIVAYISGRADSLAALFIMLSIILYQKEAFRKEYFLSVLCFLLALLAKEIAFVLPIVLLFFRQRKKTLPFFVMGFLYAVLRVTIINFSGGNPFLLKKGFALAEFTFLQRLTVFLKTLVIYLGSFFVPVRLHLERLIEYEPIGLFYFIGMAIAAFICFFVILRFRILNEKDKKLVWFFLFWFFIWLIPQSAFVFPKIMAEHFMYLPAMSISFFTAFFILNLKPSGIRYAVALFTVAYFSVFSVINNKYWHNEETFFARTVELSPHSIRARDSLAAIYIQKGRYRQAEREYLKLLSYSDEIRDISQRDKAKSSCYYNLGIVFEKMSNLDDAFMAYRLAMVFDPKMPEAYNNAALLLQRIGASDEAERLFRKAIEIDPAYYQAYNNLAQLYAQKGRVWEAIGLWMQALVIKPDYEIARRNLDAAQKLFF